MFDPGFTELLLIGVIALLVVGPQRLPGLARQAGMYVARFKRTLQGVKQDVEREFHAEELRKSLQDQGKLGDDLNQFGKSLTEDILAPPKKDTDDSK